MSCKFYDSLVRRQSRPKPWRSNSRKQLRRCCWPIGHNNTKHFFVPNQEPALAWPFGNGPVRVGTQGLFRLCLKTLSPLFSLSDWPAPGSPRMDYTLIKYAQLMRQEWTMKAAGNRTCIITLRFSDFKSQMASYPNGTWLILIKNGIIPKKWYLTIIPRDRMGSESIAHGRPHGLLTQRPWGREE